MTQSSSQTESLPRAGDRFRCQQCGMEVEVKQGCQGEQGSPRMECCGQPMTRA